MTLALGPEFLLKPRVKRTSLNLAIKHKWELGAPNSSKLAVTCAGASAQAAV